MDLYEPYAKAVRRIFVSLAPFGAIDKVSKDLKQICDKAGLKALE